MRESTQQQQHDLTAAATAAVRISISDAFDGGNIEVVRSVEVEGVPDRGATGDSADPGVVVVELRIKKDPYSELERTHHFQYFAFRATAVWNDESAADATAHVHVRFVIVNAGEVSYPQAWEGTTVCYSPELKEDDDDCWRRKLETRYHKERGVLSWSHRFGDNKESDGHSCYFAYFPPYSYRRHLHLVARCAAAAATSSLPIRVTSLGQTLDGREIDYIRVGTGPTTAWIIHRQHPGESMAAYYAEGLLTRLLRLSRDVAGEEEDDAARDRVLEQYTLHIVPCMCPDGAVRGHLRTNACGANLNREWATVRADYAAPSLARSPEVYHVLQQMDRHPPDLFLDIHGDEELPVNFLAGSQGSPPWYADGDDGGGDRRMERLHGAFLAAYVRATPDMQSEIGYTPADDPARRPVINTATKTVAARFNCFASTLEMPFKDCATRPDPPRGWSPRRSRELGATVLEPLLYIRPYLRAATAALGELPPQDQYVRPQHRKFTYGSKNEVLDL